MHLLHQFESEHSLYPKFVFDGYDLRRYAQMMRENLILKKEKYSLPKIGGIVLPDFGHAISRERGFNYSTFSVDEEYLSSRKTMVEEEKRLDASSSSFGPKD